MIIWGIQDVIFVFFPGGHNEAPAIFKKGNMFWMITSGCTGWIPNEARMFSASSIWGPWEQYPNPCRGQNSEKNFWWTKVRSYWSYRRTALYLWLMFGNRRV